MASVASVPRRLRGPPLHLRLASSAASMAMGLPAGRRLRDLPPLRLRLRLLLAPSPPAAAVRRRVIADSLLSLGCGLQLVLVDDVVVGG